jgi:hypothetical protein
MNDKTRRQLMKAMQTESTWLQKALFALNKAEDARGTVSELSDDELEALRAPAKGKWASMEDFRAVLETRVETIMEELQEARRVTI